jgi:HEAT repeat protein
MPHAAEEQRLLVDLSRPPGPLNLFGERQARLTLARLGEIGSPLGAIWTVAERVWDRSEVVAEAAAEALQKILARADTETLLEIDRRVRIRPMYLPVGDGERWARVQPGDLRRLEGFRGAYPSLMGYASLQPNGYVRQEAVRRLRAITGGEEIRYLLLRLNDWVTAVRDEAERAVEERVRPEKAAAFADHLDLVLRLPDWLRSSRLESYGRITSLLTGPELLSLTVKALKSGTPALRKAAARILGELNGSDLEVLLPEVVECPHLEIRFWLLSVVLPKLEPATTVATARSLLTDRVASVRGAALRMVAAKDPGAAEPFLVEALWDRSPAVRELARFLLGKSGRDDTAAMVRDRLRSAPERDLAGLVAALGETGTPDDAPQVLGYLSDARPRVRAAAVRGLARLDLPAHAPVIVDRVLDAAPSVSRAGREVLERRPELLDFDVLERMYAASASRHARVNILALMTHAGRWRVLRFLLEVSRGEDELSELAIERLRHWVARGVRSFVAPTIGEWSAASDALTKSLPRLGPLATEIRGQLETWRPAGLR